MAYIHHMRGAEYREWSANRILLIAPDNSVHRDATVDESRMKLPVEEDGVLYQLQSSQDRMAAELFAAYPNQHVILRMPNGQLKHVRNPALKVSRGKAGGHRYGPSPEQCQCKPWGEPHPGRHHFACTFNRTAPKEEQALEHIAKQRQKSRLYGAGTKGTLTGVVTTKTGSASVVPVEVKKPSATANLRKMHSRGGKRITPVAPAVAGVPVTAPDNCDCKAYAGAESGKHHAVCAKRPAWEQYLQNNPGIAQALATQAMAPATVAPAVPTVVDAVWTVADEVSTVDDSVATEGGPTGADDGHEVVDATGADSSEDDEAASAPGSVPVQIEQLEPSETGYYLVDVSTQKVARAADAEEVDAGMSQTIPLIKLQGKDYLLVEAALLLK